MTRRLPKSVRKFIRRQKAALRRTTQDTKQLEQALQELSVKFFGDTHERSED